MPDQLSRLLLDLLSRDAQLQSVLEQHYPTESVRCGALAAAAAAQHSSSAAAPAAAASSDGVCHSDMLA